MQVLLYILNKKTWMHIGRGVLRRLSFSSEWGVPNILGGHKIFDDQNLGSHKMTTDSVFILFKKTDFRLFWG